VGDHLFVGFVDSLHADILYDLHSLGLGTRCKGAGDVGRRGLCSTQRLVSPMVEASKSAKQQTYNAVVRNPESAGQALG